MKTKLTALLSLLLLPATVHAASGTWTSLTGGSWTNTANWSGGTVAAGADSTADFGTLDLTSAATVTFDGNQTIGTLVTDDTGATGDTNWTFNVGSSGTLTMAVTAGTPVINTPSTNAGNVVNPSTRINADVAGTSGLEKQGYGMLLLGNPNNSISGNINIAAGILGMTTNGSSALPNVTGVTVADGGQLMLGDLTAGSITNSFGKPISIAGQGPSSLGAILMRGNSVNFTLPNTITLTANARIGTFGVSATSRIEGGVTGTGELRLLGQAALATHLVRTEIRSALTHVGDTVLIGSAAAYTVPIYGNDYLPTSSILRIEPVGAVGFTVFQLNGFNQTVAGLSSPGTGSQRRVVNGSATAATLTVNDAGARTLGGCLGGTNVNDNNFRVIKQGVGAWQTASSNAFTGGLHIQGGMMSFGAGVNTFSGGIEIDLGATLRINGGGVVGNNAITNNGQVLLDYTISKTLANVISGIGGVTVKGNATGIAILSATNTYTGPTVINGTVGGRLHLSTSKALGGGDLSIGDVVTNSLAVDVAGQSITNANLTIGASFGASTFEVGIGALGNPTVPVFRVPGVLTLNGSANTVSLSGSSFTPGTFTLIKYGSLVGSLASFNPVVVSQVGMGATLIDTGTSIDVVIVSLAEEVWNGNLSSDWDLLTTLNWTNRLTAVATTYSGTSPIRFDDGALGSTAVNLTLTVSPQLTTVSNATKNYSFANTGGVLSGTGGLTKQGAATLMLSAGNDYSGATTISAGKLTISGSDAIPDGAGKGSFALNSTFDLAGFNETVNNLSGTGVVTNSTASVSTFTVTSTANSTNAGVIAGPVDFVKNGANTLTLTAGQPYTGTTTIKVGTLTPAGPSGSGLPGNVLVDGTGVARLTLGNSNQIPDTAIVTLTSSVSALRFVLAGYNETIGGLVCTAASTNIIVEAATDGVSGRPATLTFNSAPDLTNEFVSGLNFMRDASGGAAGSALSLVKTGTGAQVVGSLGGDAFISFSGGLLVSNGTMVFSNCVARSSAITNDATLIFDLPLTNTRTNAISGTGTITKIGVGTLAADSTLVASALNVVAGTLGGTGVISAPVSIGAGATLAPGNTAVGSLTVNNTLTLDPASTTLIQLNKSAATGDAVVGITTANISGTLTVTNIAGTFTGGESYPLLSATTYTGNFTATNLPALGGGLSWVWNPANATLSVVGGVASNPTNISYTVGVGTIDLAWPASHLGWYAQSNAVSVADTNFWFDIAGSQLATNLSITINPALPNVFYRLRHP